MNKLFKRMNKLFIDNNNYLNTGRNLQGKSARVLTQNQSLKLALRNYSWYMGIYFWVWGFIPALDNLFPELIKLRLEIRNEIFKLFAYKSLLMPVLIAGV